MACAVFLMRTAMAKTASAHASKARAGFLMLKEGLLSGTAEAGQVTGL
jgi:hypothetical protein